MKKFALSSFVILAFVGYAIHERYGDADAANVVAPTGISDNSLTNPSTPSPTPTILPTNNPTATDNTQDNTTMMDNTQDMMGGNSNMGNGMGMMNHTYNDGEYTGQVADAFYGLVQVKATIQNDKITDVTFLKYPSDRRTSLYISQQAMPYLKSEAIQAQSADVNIVSGATQTSRAFIESLSSALDQARI